MITNRFGRPELSLPKWNELEAGASLTVGDCPKLRLSDNYIVALVRFKMKHGFGIGSVDCNKSPADPGIRACDHVDTLQHSESHAR